MELAGAAAAATVWSVMGSQAGSLALGTCRHLPCPLRGTGKPQCDTTREEFMACPWVTSEQQQCKTRRRMPKIR